MLTDISAKTDSVEVTNGGDEIIISVVLDPTLVILRMLPGCSIGQAVQGYLRSDPSTTDEKLIWHENIPISSGAWWRFFSCTRDAGLDRTRESRQL